MSTQQSLDAASFRKIKPNDTSIRIVFVTTTSSIFLPFNCRINFVGEFAKTPDTIFLHPFTIFLLKTAGKIARDKFKFVVDKIEKFSCHIDSQPSLILALNALFLFNPKTLANSSDEMANLIPFFFQQTGVNWENLTKGQRFTQNISQSTHFPTCYQSMKFYQ